MQLTKTPPTSGQFIAIWEYNGEIWSDTFRFTEGGKLQRYVQEIYVEDVDNTLGDCWEAGELPYFENVQFITL